MHVFCSVQVLAICRKCQQSRRSLTAKVNQMHRKLRHLLICQCHPLMSLFQHHRRHEGRRSQTAVFQNRGINITIYRSSLNYAKACFHYTYDVLCLKVIIPWFLADRTIDHQLLTKEVNRK